MQAPVRANERWSLDFVSDQMSDGRRFRILTVVDDCTRECLALVADTSLSGARVARELNAIVGRRGRPATIVSDNRTEFTSNACSGGPIAPASPGITSPRQAPAERLRRELQWPLERRTAERDPVLLAGSRSRPAGSLARRLQPRAPSLEPGLGNAVGLRPRPGRMSERAWEVRPPQAQFAPLRGGAHGASLDPAGPPTQAPACDPSHGSAGQRPPLTSTKLATGACHPDTRQAR